MGGRFNVWRGSLFLLHTFTQKSSKMDLFVQICPDAFGGLSVFPLKKRGNGRYRVDSSSYESKVGDYQDNKTMQKNQSDIED